MVTVVLDEAGRERAWAALPRRVTLSHAALETLAVAGGVRVPWRTGAKPRSTVDPAAELAAGGLVVGARIPGDVAAALARLSQAEVAVDLNLTLRCPSGVATQLAAWHRVVGRDVTAVASTTEGAELSWFGLDWWPAVLTALAEGSLPVTADGTGPAARLCLPLELLLAACTAVRDHHDELVAALAQRFPGAVTVEGAVLDQDGAREQLEMLAREPTGRLQVVVAGVARRVGILSWLRFPDGWRAVQPVRGGVSPLVRLDRVDPAALAARVAWLTMKVRR